MRSRRGAQHNNFLHGCFVDQDAGQLLLRRDDHAVLGLDTKRGGTRGDCIQCILNLHQLARGAEGCEGEAVGVLAHGARCADKTGCGVCVSQGRKVQH